MEPASRHGGQEKPILLKTITLKDGETLDLGKIDLQRPETPDDDDDTDVVFGVGEDESGEDKPLR